MDSPAGPLSPQCPRQMGSGSQLNSQAPGLSLPKPGLNPRKYPCHLNMTQQLSTHAHGKTTQLNIILPWKTAANPLLIIIMVIRSTLRTSKSLPNINVHPTPKHRLYRDFPGGPVTKFLHSSAGGPDWVPGQRTRSHMLQLKILHAATKTDTAK